MTRYSGLDDQRRWSLPEALYEQADRQDDAVWLTTVEGERLTFAEAAQQASQVATWLQDHGVSKGDHVAVMLHNGLDFVRLWLGLSQVGAVAVLLNTELSGRFLKHQLTNSGASALFVEADLWPNVEELAGDLTDLRNVAVLGSASPPIPFTDLEFEGWRKARPAPASVPDPADIACIMYTSGTSGPAKGVLMPHAHCALYGIGAIEAFQLHDDDKYYIALPLYHANGLLMQLGTTILAGIPAVLRKRFSASEWLPDIREHGATITHLLGALGAFLTEKPEQASDRDHRLRAILNGPNIEAIERVLRERFGIADVISGFGMTEVNVPIWGRVGHPTPGACGWVDDRHFDVGIVDPETDRPVATGETGEIVVRPKVPFGFMAGYHAMPQKTVEAWRNLWFHTGDAGRIDADGVVTFIDRIKDCIRRRGENIAAGEVETALADLPGVAQVAAYAVPADIIGGEDELMLAVVANNSTNVDPREIGALAAARLPRFARPRYVEIVDTLPVTSTGKVQRAVLRERGCAGAVDLESPRS